MKRGLAIAALLIANAAPAHADVYVKVDAQGNAIGGAIVCDAATCGAGSLYSQLTLGEGERYVLQGVGVDYGIGNNNPNTGVKHDDRSNEWVVTREPGNGDAPVVERFEVITSTPAPVLPPTIVETTTVISDTATAIDSATALIDTSTAVMADIDWSAFLKMFEAWFKSWFIGWWRP